MENNYILSIIYQSNFANIHIIFVPFLWFSLTGCHGFPEHLASNQEAMKNKNIVNLGAIRQGMKRFQFLLNCCEPGTIPDASILAAALDLVCSSYTHVLDNLHFLSVHSCINHKIHILTSSAIHGLASFYLLDPILSSTLSLHYCKSSALSLWHPGHRG